MLLGDVCEASLFYNCGLFIATSLFEHCSQPHSHGFGDIGPQVIVVAPHEKKLSINPLYSFLKIVSQ